MVRSSLGQKSCCWTRFPQSLCSMLKLIFSLASVAEKSLTGMLTRPKAICPEANARGMSTPFYVTKEMCMLAEGLSVVGCRLSVVGCRLSVVGCRYFYPDGARAQ